jgi:hypothetical protein
MIVRARAFHFLFSFLLFGIAGCGPALQSPQVSPQLLEQEAELQRELTFKTFVDRQNRLQRIYTRLRIANADMCGSNLTPVVGISGIDRASIPSDLRATAHRLYGIADGVKVLDVVPNSPASEAGLQLGDVITGAAKGAMPSGWTWSGLTVADLVKVITTSEGNPITLLVRRSGSTFPTTLKPRMGCRYPIQLEPSERLNAYSDGSRIVVLTGLFNHIPDDREVAVIVAHELAHNVLEHMTKKQTNAAIGGTAGLLIDIGLLAAGVNTQGMIGQAGADAGAKAYSQEFEFEADYLGLYMLARAGLDITAGPEVFRRMGAEKPGSQVKNYFSTHPSTPERAAAMTQTIFEIREKEAKNLALLPTTLPGQTFAVTPTFDQSPEDIVVAQPKTAQPTLPSATVPSQATTLVPVTQTPKASASQAISRFAQLYLIRGPVVTNPPQTFSAEFLDTGHASVVLSGRRRLTGQFETFGINDSIATKYNARLIEPDTVKPGSGGDAKGFAFFSDTAGWDMECAFSLTRATGRGRGICADNQSNTYQIVFE